MTTAIDFQTRTKHNLIEFLNSALVVDEEATFFLSSRSAPKSVITPGRGSVIGKDEDETDNNSDTNNHKLFCQEIIDAFADKGIVCGVFRPENGNGWTKRVVKAASNADIVILDWNLQVKDDDTGIDETGANAGSHATNIIKMLAEKDLGSGRIRMIAIYTAETISDEELLNNIDREIYEIAASNGKVNIQKNGNVMTAGPMIIAVIRKNGSSSSDRYAESDLPDYLLDILVAQHNGLLMNAAIAAVTALRQNTFQLLNLFSSRMDAAYIAHRIGQKTPDEAEEHFLHVMVSDLQEILESANVCNNLTSDTLLSWTQDKYERNDLNDKFFEVTFPEAKNTLEYLLNFGILAIEKSDPSRRGLNNKAFQWALKNKSSKRKNLSEITAQFVNDSSHDESNRLWAKRTSVRHHYGKPEPFLRTGTILQTRRGGKDEYLICVQPECDCRRIEREGKDFIFLPAAKPEKDFNPNDTRILIKFDDQWQDWKVSTFGYDIRKIRFTPMQENDVVRACKKTSNYWFFTGADGYEYRWLGALKSLHVQRIIQRLAENISRVGLIESEWYRKTN